MTTIIRKRPTKSLSEREKRLIQRINDGKDFFWAMIDAGYARSTACTQQRRMRSKLPIQKALIAARMAKRLYVTPAEKALVAEDEKV
ncbi:MAG TPA: hypothetical protein VLX29_05400 [Nitrospirota bacterium]|nr:hypothetical protein [Nitrospirota bacterium]